MRASRLAALLCAALALGACAAGVPPGAALPSPSVGVPSPSPSGAVPSGMDPSRAPPASAIHPPTASASTDPLAAVRHPMSDLSATRLLAEVATGGETDWQASGFGSLWVGTGGGGVVVRIDLATNHVIASIPVAGPCLGMATGFGAVWSVSCGAHEVDRLDPATNAVVARIPVPGIAGEGEGQVVAAFGGVWLFTDSVGTLVRIDPTTNRIGAKFAVGGGVALVATADDLWATVPETDTVLVISPRGEVVGKIAVGRGPRFIAAGEGGVWSLGQGEGDVTRIDPATRSVVAKIAVEVPGDGGCIAADAGGVWVTMPSTPFSQIDPSTNRVAAQYVGEGGDCISVAGGSVWLSNHDTGNVWRVRP